MLRRSGVVVLKAVRELFANWRALGIVITIYALLLVTLYVLVMTKEATKFQVGVTIALVFAAPVLFFCLQSFVAGIGANQPARRLIVEALQKAWKLFVVSIPVGAVVILTAYLLNKLQTRYGIVPQQVGPVGTVSTANTKPPIHYPALAITTVRYILLAVVAPLTLIHLWISTRRDGLIATFKGIRTHLTRAFGPESVLIYIAGFVVFAVLPYFILFKTTTSSRAWLDLGLLSARLVAVFLITLLGWLLTVRALSLSIEPPTSAASVDL
jgi:hypothetical protein